MESIARVIAIYLPQFHPIPENDLWWGKGFTEWTNVGKARPLFRGHYQPRVPTDLGYYDLRVPETRKAQADMARDAGIEGFMYWHYWFGNGKRLIERPFNEVVASGEPDFPFSLAWANESWKGFNHGLKNRNTLIEQVYPGEQDIIDHFNTLLAAFKDSRYIKVDGKLLFMIYKPLQHPDIKRFIEIWQELAQKSALPGFYFVAHHQTVREFDNASEEETLNNMLNLGFSAVNFVRLHNVLEQRNLASKISSRLNKITRGMPLIVPYKKAARFFTKEIDKNIHAIPSIIPGWDHTPRSKKEGLVMTGSDPYEFSVHIKKVLKNISNKPLENRLVFIKSWNEWAEGNYMEPDLKWGNQFLQKLKEELKS